MAAHSERGAAIAPSPGAGGAKARVTLPREWFVPALIGVILAASIEPCRGAGARVFDVLAIFAIASLFFLQGARLSRDAVTAGMTNWRLHLRIHATTFVLFPILGTGLIALFPNGLNTPLRIGLLFVCVLPTTVQSSIALTSIAGGDVAGAICAATTSNLIGVALSPFLLAGLTGLHGHAVNLSGLRNILLELLLPFVIGHALRRWIGGWADRNRAVLAVTDRGSILLVVYTAFSAAVVHGIWKTLPPVMLANVLLFDALLFAGALVAIRLVSCGFGVSRADEAAMVFCGSQKSVVAGVPIAGLLFAPVEAGTVVVPIMLYYLMQLVVGAWLARRYAGKLARVPLRPARRPVIATMADAE